MVDRDPPTSRLAGLRRTGRARLQEEFPAGRHRVHQPKIRKSSFLPRECFVSQFLNFVRLLLTTVNINVNILSRA
jgi:hypothetical protein